MRLKDFIFGKPLATSQERAEQIGPASGIPIFGLDALSSAGYGPEAALTILLPVGILGVGYIVPISASIVVLLAIVYFSYLQTIKAYPSGGGSYTVAHENLGESASLLAAAALMIDYILTAAVGISAGVGALVSALPRLQPHTLLLCIGILLFIALINLRGLREAGALFMLPTLVFVGSLLLTIGLGLFRAWTHGGHPVAVAAPHPLGKALPVVTVWLLLQSFASGCTAMTGVEAVSNGVMAFREPRVKNARVTLSIIIGILVALLLGIAYVARFYSIGATNPDQPGYDSVLSQLIAAVAGKGVFYYVAIASVLLVLSLSANTAFADFPRLCHAVARNGYLPKSFTTRGRRLVYSQGIFALTLVAGALLVLFKGVTDRLIPLYAIGAFLAFTLSQAGMVAHWKKIQGRHFLSMFLNGLGAITTAITVVVVLVAKFAEGAWITLALIPVLFFLMKAIRRQYLRMEKEIELAQPLRLDHLEKPLVIVPITGWNRITEKALRFAFEISPDIHAVHIHAEEDECHHLLQAWKDLVEAPARDAGFPPPQLKVVGSPYRFILHPLLQHINEVAKSHPQRQIAVIIPEKIDEHWYHYLLHNKRAALLKAQLYFSGNRRVVVMNIPWYLGDGD
ncbi:MAG TPA: APC family permease [Candidatus Saccharimonadales bacterium]|nr:APC family permease [Candidatus Saccharimonadales bacterium]